MKKIIYLIIIGMLFISCNSTSPPDKQTTVSQVSPKEQQKKLSLEEKKDILKEFKIEKDEFKKIAFATPKILKRGKGLNSYITLSEDLDPVTFRIDMEYHGHSWVFIRNIYIKADDIVIKIPVDGLRDRKSHVIYGGGVLEWVDFSINQQQMEEFYHNIDKILYAKEVKIKFDGEDREYSQTISKNQIDSLKQVVDTYRSLGGK
jgi:hypothetical protein